jgi:vitamin K-dependent gamma-carboxylase
MTEHKQTEDTYTTLRAYLFKPVSSSGLGIFRILWGFIMLYYFGVLAAGGGKYKYLDTIFEFKYPFFDWVKVLPEPLMYSCFYVGVVFSLLMITGLYYKLTSKVLFVLYTYIFLLDASYWNNHYYAYALISAFFVITDAHKSYSLDKKRLNLDESVPMWQVLLFRFQFIIIYFYGGLSKLQNKDWMDNLSGYSMLQNNLKWRHEIIYPLSLIVTYGGLLYDLSIGFLLLWKRTLWFSLPFIIVFNISNSYLFNIGSFPYAMLSSFILFIPPDLIRNKFSNLKTRQSANSKLRSSDRISQQLIISFLFLYLTFQILFPFRSLLYEGSVFWTAEGKLGAWHMMASSNYVDAEDFLLLEYNDAKTIVIKRENLEVSKYLSQKQMRTMGTFPFMIPQFAKFLKKEAELAGFKNVSITGKVYLSRNYRPKVLLIDPDEDLSTLEVSFFKHNSWILRYNTEDGYFAE